LVLLAASLINYLQAKLFNIWRELSKVDKEFEMFVCGHHK
jgi:hypothetical protein